MCHYYVLLKLVAADDIRIRTGCDSTMLTRPILYCCYLTRIYEETRREELRELIQAKLRVFNEEELNVQLVLFDQVLDHITRIDRVLRQPLGHLLLGTPTLEV